MRRFLLSALVVLLLLLALAQGAILTIYFLGPRSALDQPSDSLLFITDLGTTFLIPDQDKTRLNPQANNTDAVNTIRRVYQSRCEVCHNPDGKGQSVTGSRIFPRAGDLTSARVQARSDGSLYWIIGNGLPHTGMPGWKDILNEDEIWQLVDYVRALPQGIPAASAAVSPTVVPTGPSIQFSNTLTVSIADYTYVPADITVTVGTRVVWQALDDDAHTVTSKGTTRTLDSPALFRGQAYEFVFTAPGVYPYYCFPHNYMLGTVTVK
jgi:plastocyanin/mono/diheme cytochrome c family protein